MGFWNEFVLKTAYFGYSIIFFRFGISSFVRIQKYLQFGNME